MTRSQTEALDCWAHGLAHLIAAYGTKQATEIAACGILAVVDEPPAPSESARRSRDIEPFDVPTRVPFAHRAAP